MNVTYILELSVNLHTYMDILPLNFMVGPLGFDPILREISQFVEKMTRVNSCVDEIKDFVKSNILYQMFMRRLRNLHLLIY